MLALAIKNLMIVIIVILILHIAIKTYLYDRKMLRVDDHTASPVPISTTPVAKETFIAPVDDTTTTQQPIKAPLVPIPPPPAHTQAEHVPPQNPQSLDNLFKYILDTSPSSTAAVTTTKEPSNSDPLGFDTRMFSNIQASNEGDGLYESWK